MRTIARFARLLILAPLILGPPARSWAQSIPSPDYVTYLPREPMSAVSATEPSTRFRLFGDPTAADYRDVDPRDGIDDRRDRLFLALGLRFAPWLVRNAYGFPMDYRRLVQEHDVPLVRDRLNLARHDPSLLSSDTLRLAVPSPPCSDANPQGTDCRLLDLLRTEGPQATRDVETVSPDLDAQEVLYFDTPGDGPKSWAREYGGKSGFDVSPSYIGYAKVYVHPFIAEAAPGPDGPRFEFVIQYWFYYSSNDSGNYHEGDWEHINVMIAPRERVAEPLDEATVTAILDGRLDPESLVIQRIDYYFHHWIFPVDYSRPDVYLRREEWQRQRDTLATTREGERDTWDAIRRRAYLDADQTRINLHPLVFIGGNLRGLNLLLRAPGSLGLSSHGSYPFPGLYKAVGPAGTGESIDRPTDLHLQAPPLGADERAEIERYDRPDRLEILPDWEALADLALQDYDVRWRWAWFLVPAHVGYPATVSPFAGVIRYADTGNVGPVSPAYNGGWNRMGASAGYSDFVPHRISGLFPLDVQDAYTARWGFLNAVYPTITFVPPFDVLIRALEKPIEALIGDPRPTYARGEDVPPRRLGLGFGTTYFQPPGSFGNLLGFPELSGPIIQRANDITGTPLIGYGLAPAQFDALFSLNGEIDLYLGNHFVTTNSLGHGISRMRQLLVFSDYPDQQMRADLNLWQYTGSLRWNLATRRFQPFVRAGYGLTWYRLEDLTAFGENLGSSRWVRRPAFFDNLVPNTWQAGVGVEVLPSYGFGRLNVGVKGTADLQTYRLGLTTNDNTTVFFQDVRITRFLFGLAATAAF